ncbi:MAG TPA: preprotein translocase subunit SecE [Acidimicrobiales bacterium]|nr:preprotein translocase subunit SecE [Acidimicrobiales bacterium]
MAMNREQKRLLQKQGEIDADGTPKATRRAPQAPKPKEQRTKPRQFVREVRGEMRKVNWPTRAETLNYSVIVFVTIVIMTALIAGVDFGLSKAILWIYDA